jgi:hypothetical protein
MKSTITTGAIRISAISDGDSRLPALFYAGLDFAGRTGLLAGEGRTTSLRDAS